MLEGALIAGGITISYWIDLGFSFLDPSSVAWRFPIAFQNVFALDHPLASCLASTRIALVG